MPCLVSWILLEAIITDNPNTFLVSSGRITPSSHSLAVEKQQLDSFSQFCSTVLLILFSSSALNYLPSLFIWALFTCTSTLAACYPPITAILALGHIYNILGLYARPHIPQLPAPQDAPIRQVILGTPVVATALTILDPCLAIPSCSYFLPTIKPVIFCRKIRGIFLIEQISIKLAPFCALSLKRIPLLATIPTSCPYSLPKPVSNVFPYSFLYSWNLEPSRIRANTSLLSKVFFKSVETIELSSLASKRGSSMLERSNFTLGVFKDEAIFLPIQSASSSFSAK